METQKEQMSYEKIANMSRDELINYLIKNCTDISRHMPSDIATQRKIWSYQRPADMRELAFDVYRKSLMSDVNSSV